MGEIGPKRTPSASKELKVENWAPYFLQRLFHMFNQSMHCDLTLRFCGTETLRVHRVVLYACTDYFDSLAFENDTLDMDDSMTVSIVSHIIRFMYTGKIEIMPQTWDKLYEVATALRMPILTRLIESHRMQEVNSTPTPTTSRATPRQDKVIDLGQIPSVVPAPPVAQPSFSTSIELPKRLPIWKRKSSPMITLNPIPASCMIDGMGRVVLSKPIPTRLEWDDPIGDEFTISSAGESVRYLSHDGNVPVPQPLILDDVVCVLTPPSPAQPPITTISPLKRPRRSEGVDLTNMKEFGRQQQIRNELMKEEEEYADDPSDILSISPQNVPKPILKQITRTDSTESPKRVRFTEPEPSVSITTALPKTTPATPEEEIADPSVITDDPSPVEPIEAVAMETMLLETVPVRTLSMETIPIETQSVGTVSVETVPITVVETESVPQSSTTSGELLLKQVIRNPPEPLKRVRYSVLSADGTQTDQLPGSPVGNPAKIVSEVLKKYPDLVSGSRKNIKLKVMTNNTASEGHSMPNTSASGNVSYIVVKGGEGNADDGKNELDPESKGPWKCTSCAKGTGVLFISFATYSQYYAHLSKVHHMRIDARICEYCGLKIAKRNLLMFHQHTKHGVAPPPPFDFPKCGQCDLPCLNQNSLHRHMESVHGSKEAYLCTVCNVSFKSSVVLGKHQLESCQPEPPAVCDRRYRCPYCEAVFSERSCLQEHIVSMHWAPEKKETPDSQPSVQPEESIAIINKSSEPSMEKYSGQPVSEESVEMIPIHDLELPQQHPVKTGDTETNDSCNGDADVQFIVCNQPVNETFAERDPASHENLPSNQRGGTFETIDQTEGPEIAFESHEYQSETTNSEEQPTSRNQILTDELDRVQVDQSQTKLAYQDVEKVTKVGLLDDSVPNSNLDPPTAQELLVYQPSPIGGNQVQSEARPPSVSYTSEETNDSLQATRFEAGTEVTYQAETQNDHSESSLIYTPGDEQTEPVYQEQNEPPSGDSGQCLTYETGGGVSEVYPTQGDVSGEQMVYHVDHAEGEQGMVYETNAERDQSEDFEAEVISSQAESSYEEMELTEEVPPSEEMVTDPEEAPGEVDGGDEVMEELEDPEDRGGQGDHDYPYNSVVMFQPNMVLPQRVMLVTHPIAHPLQVLLANSSMMSDQLVSIPYPQCGTVQVVSGGQVVTTSGQVMTTTVPTDCTHSSRERKVEPETLVNDWDESSQAEAIPPVVLPGSGPSRPEFF